MEGGGAWEMETSENLAHILSITGDAEGAYGERERERERKRRERETAKSVKHQHTNMHIYLT